MAIRNLEKLSHYFPTCTLYEGGQVIKLVCSTSAANSIMLIIVKHPLHATAHEVGIRL